MGTVGTVDLEDGAEVLVLDGVADGAVASADSVEDLEDGPEDTVDLVDGAVDLVDGAADSVAGAMIHSGTHSGAVDLADGAADSVAGVDGTLTLPDTGTHTDPFFTVVV